MIRRFLCLGVILMMTSLPACSDTQPTPKAPAVPDPEGNVKPKIGGAKGN
jgi:hypothetical protein